MTMLSAALDWPVWMVGWPDGGWLAGHHMRGWEMGGGVVISGNDGQNYLI